MLLIITFAQVNRMEKKVLDKFKQGDKPDGLRKDPYITRVSLEKKITDAYFDRDYTGRSCFWSGRYRQVERAETYLRRPLR